MHMLYYKLTRNLQTKCRHSLCCEYRITDCTHCVVNAAVGYICYSCLSLWIKVWVLDRMLLPLVLFRQGLVFHMYCIHGKRVLSPKIKASFLFFQLYGLVNGPIKHTFAFLFFHSTKLRPTSIAVCILKGSEMLHALQVMLSPVPRVLICRITSNLFVPIRISVTFMCRKGGFLLLLLNHIRTNNEN